MKIPGSFHVPLITPWHPPNSALPDQNVVSSPSWPVVRGRLTLQIQESCREPLRSLRSLYMGRRSLSFHRKTVVFLFCWVCELVEESYIIRGGRTGNSDCDHPSKADGSLVCLSALLLESGTCRALRGADISQQKPPTYPTSGKQETQLQQAFVLCHWYRIYLHLILRLTLSRRVLSPF